MFNLLESHINKIKQTKPLILNLSNYVTMDFIANGLLSLGASPIMSHSHDELNDLISIASTLVINLGTLDKNFLELSHHACEIANQQNKPIILDPVGIGASTYRTDSALQLLNQHKFAIIRGNASEIAGLTRNLLNSKGVDSSIDSEYVIQHAHEFSQKTNAGIVVSGKTDYIINPTQILNIERGHELMSKVTGMGCLLSAVIAAFHAIEKDAFLAAQSAVTFYGACGEIAATKTSAPGSFKIYFIDELSSREYYENK